MIIFKCSQSGKLVALKKGPPEGSPPFVEFITGKIKNSCSTFDEYWSEIKANGGVELKTTSDYDDLVRDFSRTMQCLTLSSKATEQ